MKIPAVIVLAERQRPQVDRLVEYCKKLDGTEITVIEAPEYTNLAYPKCNDASFHYAASQFKGKPFLWMEPDAIPLKAGWKELLTTEYLEAKKEFMLTSDTNPPHDLTGGIGIYGPRTHWLLPKEFQKDAWDYWMLRYLKPLIHFTPLIQHCYGRYLDGHATPLRFPKDQVILRPNAVLYHRDKFQDLITPVDEQILEPERKQIVFKHGGDLGDILAALPILRALGGGKVVLFHDPNAPHGQKGRESLEGRRYEAIKPLLEAQPYVDSVEWGEGIDTQNFRTVARPINESLTERQARHIGKWPIDLAPWIRVPSFEAHKRIVVARSLRYPNLCGFPWKEAWETYGDRLLFVGLPDEHTAFQNLIGNLVEHAKTDDFLQVATILAGAPQVMANQSSIAWVALGLGSKLILEGWPDAPNTEIPRPGSFFAYTQEHMDTIRRAFAAVKAKQ